ncbi:hypothetical protein HZB02_07220 [Candidatus Woesearchaeota archaeon]|nr:hypothetical protein [Candidatus Woesearchaeota archaeon]
MAFPQEAYDTLKKKYSLPDAAELNRHFGIGQIEQQDFLLREIRKEILKKFEFFQGLCEGLLNPEGNVWDLYESRLLTEQQKTKIFQTYRKLMMFLRSSLILSIIEDEAKDAAFLSAALKEWLSLHEELLHIADHIKQAWKTEESYKSVLDYMG